MVQIFKIFSPPNHGERLPKIDFLEKFSVERKLHDSSVLLEKVAKLYEYSCKSSRISLLKWSGHYPEGAGI